MLNKLSSYIRENIIYIAQKRPPPINIYRK